MTIIYFQNQECKVCLDPILTNDMLIKDLFKKLFQSTLKSSVYIRLINTLTNSLRYKSSQSKYNRVYDVIDNTFNKQDSRYSKAMSHFKKLGIILENKGALHLNPLVESRTSSKFYELVIEYYNLLWSDEFKSQVYITYKDLSFSLPTVEGLKNILIEDYKLLLQNDSDFYSLSSDDLYNITFKYKKAELAEQFPFIEEANLKALKAKINRIYTNLGYNLMKQIAIVHKQILFEQLPIKELDNNQVAFGRLPKNWKCIHFTETNVHQEMISDHTQQQQEQSKPAPKHLTWEEQLELDKYYIGLLYYDKEYNSYCYNTAYTL